MYRTHNLGELNIKNIGENVELSGWVQKVRDLGAMVFIDLRDEQGVTQIVINDEDVKTKVKEITTESCIHIFGKVVERASKNNQISTGDIRTVDVTVRRIREKIEKDTSDPRILVTKRGVGYYIANPN